MQCNHLLAGCGDEPRKLGNKGVINPDIVQKEGMPCCMEGSVAYWEGLLVTEHSNKPSKFWDPIHGHLAIIIISSIIISIIISISISISISWGITGKSQFVLLWENDCYNV